MMPAYRLCLLLAIGAILAVSVSGASTAGARNELDAPNSVVDARNQVFEALDALRHLPRTKRELGVVGTIIGGFFLLKAKVLTWLNDAFDIPARTIVNTFASLANYFNGNQGPFGDFGKLFG